jgi:hypothetical protein
MGGDDALLDGAAPPGGLCTARCDSDADCTQLKPGALCYPFAEGGSGYCIEGCAFGEPPLGSLKCHGRADFACAPALLADTDEACETTETCGDGELCIDDTCTIVYPACLPSCRGDLDCAEGWYCDQSFLTGTCVPEKPVGKRLGEPCEVPGPDQPAEPDECLGFCQADYEGSAQGHCGASCGLLNECAWDAASQKFDGVCFYASVLTSDVGSTGDLGFCTPSCNCSDECDDESLACVELPQGRLPDTFRGAGLCFSPAQGDIELDECSE